MTKYSLTERQKNVLREIEKGLGNGTIDPKWLYILLSDGVVEVAAADTTGTLWKVRTAKVRINDVDFDKYIEAAFFNYEGNSCYTLDTQKIIDAVKSNFGEEDQSDSNPSSKVEAVFGVPSSDYEFKCDVFMIMPFAEEFESIYRDYIKPTVEDLGLSIRRGDDFFSRNEIIHEVWSAINASNVVIADCTGRNPNVFYELGIAHTLGKTSVLITQDINDAPFDIRGKRFIVYQDNSAGLKVLRDKLKEYISKAAKK